MWYTKNRWKALRSFNSEKIYDAFQIATFKRGQWNTGNAIPEMGWTLMLKLCSLCYYVNITSTFFISPNMYLLPPPFLKIRTRFKFPPSAPLSIFFRWKVQNIPVLKQSDTVFARKFSKSPQNRWVLCAKGCILRFIQAQALGTVCRAEPSAELFALHSPPQWDRMLNYICWKCILDFQISKKKVET